MTIPDVLDKAADTVAENGHHKGDYYDVDLADRDGLPPDAAPVCALGAIIVGSGGSPATGIYRCRDLAVDTARVFSRFLDKAGTGTVAPVVDWNDAPERAATEVIDALRACAAEQRLAVGA